MTDLYDVDPTFARDLHLSERAVYVVTSFLRHKGFSVTLPPITVRKRGESVRAHTDSFDLEAEQHGQRFLVEVKRRGVEFTGAHDFPYREVIIDAAAHYDTLQRRPRWYFLLNSPCDVALVARGDNPTLWQRKRIHSNKRGRERDYYLAPIELFETRAMETL